ncbi:hypothetical protein NEMIN01_0578 [Nematocida minor]|uniref:uncharacterized protein n=1 Tax=Nematocida minor TaxID=1912983 RepID=UPI00221F1E0A|nr:uncharacterized protein NEMIN01_0578 [Nematocida minor]KAI5189625.1 hypothetical protein NEMIN01_0578 [Nematocida minor]
MTTERIKRLAEADKKAKDIIQEARREGDALLQKTIEKSQEYEKNLEQAKVEEVKRYFQQANEELAQMEESIIKNVKETIADIRSKNKQCEEIVDELVKIVIS